MQRVLCHICFGKICEVQGATIAFFFARGLGAALREGGPPGGQTMVGVWGPGPDSWHGLGIGSAQAGGNTLEAIGNRQ